MSLGHTAQGQGPNWAAGTEPSHRSESLSGQSPFSWTETCLEAKVSSLPFEQRDLQVTGCLMASTLSSWPPVTLEIALHAMTQAAAVYPVCSGSGATIFCALGLTGPSSPFTLSNWTGG